MRSPGPQTICERNSYAKHAGSSLKSEQKLAEHARLLEAREGTAPWRQWSPYLIEQQWGTLSVEQGQGPELAPIRRADRDGQGLRVGLQRTRVLGARTDASHVIPI
jgi:hypothetical protein